jgi:hypothetical protein
VSAVAASFSLYEQLAVLPNHLAGEIGVGCWCTRLQPAGPHVLAGSVDVLSKLPQDHRFEVVRARIGMIALGDW